MASKKTEKNQENVEVSVESLSLEDRIKALEEEIADLYDEWENMV